MKLTVIRAVRLLRQAISAVYLLIFFWMAFLLIGPIACTKKYNESDHVFTVGLEGSPINLDPRLATDAYSARVIQIVYNGLLKKTPESTLIGDLAEQWEMPDTTTYIFHLRQGVKFHDGSDFAAEDVKYTFESLLDPQFPSPLKESYSQLVEIKVLSPYTIKFSLKEVFAPFLTNMILGILPKPETTAKNQGDLSATHPIGTGPFKFIDWEPDESLSFQAFDDYFEGKPHLGRLVYRIIPDETIRLLELKKGNIDFLQNALSPDVIASLENHPHLQIKKALGTNYTYLGFNLEDPILCSRSVREAITRGINRKEIIKHLLANQAEPASGVLAPGNWAYEPKVTTYEYNPPEAMRLLDEAGFPDPDGQGPLKRFPLTYKTSYNELSKRIAEIIQQNLEEIGLEVKIQSYEWGTFFADIKAGNFQIYSLQWVGVTEPDIYFSLFHSSSIPPHGSNRGRYINHDLDRLLEEGRKTLDLEKRKKIYSLVQKKLAYDLPYVNLWYQTNVVALTSQVKGYILYPAGDFTSLKDILWTADI